MKVSQKIPSESQLLKGVGASAWFYISKENKHYRIKRFSIQGDLECSKLFSVRPDFFDINQQYKFTYLSHCKECKIVQNNNVFIFTANEN